MVRCGGQGAKKGMNTTGFRRSIFRAWLVALLAGVPLAAGRRPETIRQVRIQFVDNGG